MIAYSNIKSVVFLLAAFCISSSVWTQEYIIQCKNLGTDNGLPHNNINGIVEDDQNLIWIATQNGVCRYEGHGTTIFNQHNSRIRNDRIMKILKDKKGMIWLVSNPKIMASRYLGESDVVGTIDILNPKTLQILPFDEYFQDDLSAVKEKDIKLVSSTDIGIWILTEEIDYFLYDSNWKRDKFEKFSKYSYVLPLKDKTYIGFYNNTFEHFSKQKIISKDSLSENRRIKKVWIDNEHKVNIWGSEKYYNVDIALFKYDIKKNILTQELTEKQVHGTFLREINPTHRQVLDNGIKISRTLDQLSIAYDNDTIVNKENYKKYNIQNGLKDFFIAKNNDIYVFTGWGIAIFSIRKNPFLNHLDQAGQSYSTRGILELDSSQLLVNTYNGQYVIHKKSTVERISSFMGMGLVKDSQGTIWSGVHGNSLLQIKSIDSIKSIILQTVKSNNIPSTVIFEDSRNRLWIGSNQGLYFKHPETSQIEIYHLNSEQDKNDEPGINHIIEEQSLLWVACTNGITSINLNNQNETYYSLTKTNGIPTHIRHIYIDNNGVFWLSTRGDGLIKWHPENGIIDQITTADGLSNNTVHAVYEDDYGFLWVSTNHGLNQIDHNTGEIQIFLEEDGIPWNEFNWLSHYKSSTGRLYFGGVKGITSFDPQDFQHINTSSVSKIRILDIEVLNKTKGIFESRINDYHQNKSIEISPGNTFINVMYTLTNLNNDKNNRYAFKFEDQESEWNYTKDHTLRFSRLPYGHQKLLIKGQGSNGRWSEAPVVIDIYFKKPFYLTTLFFVLCGLTLALGIYYFLNARTNYFKRRANQLKQQVTLRTKQLEELNKSNYKLFGILAHDLKYPISSFRDLGENLRFLIRKREWDTIDKMADQIENKITHLDKLLDNLLPWVRAQMKDPQLSIKRINVYKIIESSISESNIQSQNKQLTIHSDIPNSFYANVNMDSLKIILRNILNNAIKYSNPGKSIYVSVNELQTQVEIMVRDEGVGMTEEEITSALSDYSSSPGTENETGFGLGLKLSRDLAISNGGKLEITSEKGVGTEVKLVLGNA